MNIAIDIVIIGLGIASIWALISIFLKFNLKAQLVWWLVVIVPMCMCIAGMLERIGITQWLKKVLSN
jgi:hypothetical protein